MICTCKRHGRLHTHKAAQHLAIQHPHAICTYKLHARPLLTSGHGATGAILMTEAVLTSRQAILAALEQHKQAMAAVDAELAQAAGGRGGGLRSASYSQQHAACTADTSQLMQEDGACCTEDAAELAVGGAKSSSQQYKGGDASTAHLQKGAAGCKADAAEMACSDVASSSQQYGGCDADTAHPMEEDEADCAAGSSANALLTTQDSEEGSSSRKKRRWDEFEPVEGMAPLSCLSCDETNIH